MAPIMGKDSVEEHFDEIALNYDYWKEKNSYYYDTIKTFALRIIPPGSNVLEVGCGPVRFLIR